MNQAPGIPTLDDVHAARERIAPFRRRRSTPTPDLSELVGTEIWVKHENHQPVGAFKVRGGINLAAQLTAAAALARVLEREVTPPRRTQPQHPRL